MKFTEAEKFAQLGIFRQDTRAARTDRDEASAKSDLPAKLLAALQPGNSFTSRLPLLQGREHSREPSNNVRRPGISNPEENDAGKGAGSEGCDPCKIQVKGQNDALFGNRFGKICSSGRRCKPSSRRCLAPC